MKVKINHLGTQGDGVAISQNGDELYVPYVLEGEVVEIASSGNNKLFEAQEIIQPSPHRQKAPCAHFTICGGCSLQHMDKPSYESFKKKKVQTELSRHGLEFDVEEGVFIPAHSRRRTSLKSKRFGRKVVLGYMEKKSHKLVDVSKCLVLEKKIENLIEPLRNVLQMLLEKGDSAEIWMTSSKAGVDVKVFSDDLSEISLEVRESLADFARENKLARLVVSYQKFEDTIVQFSEPYDEFSGVQVPISCDTFLQASLEADMALSGFIEENILMAEGAQIADLFCGRGTLTFACKNNKVDAFEADRVSLSVLTQSAKRARKNVQTHLRNLFAEPLDENELKKFDYVVLDPPRAGAKAQCEKLAKSIVPKVIYISCNPASFARDAAALVDGGYKLEKCVALDQFIYSSHVEVMSVFGK